MLGHTQERPPQEDRVGKSGGGHAVVWDHLEYRHPGPFWEALPIGHRLLGQLGHRAVTHCGLGCVCLALGLALGRPCVCRVQR